ncbi:MAG: hypothetical protein NVSMB52_10330 [Chloroflexota bacterium]
MRAGEARDVARQWVMEEGRDDPHLHGAYFAGSLNWLSDDAPVPATSDVDVNLVLNGSIPPGGRRKFLYRGVLIEVTYLSMDGLSSLDVVLSNYHLAGGFRVPSIILDPSGQLTELNAAVARGFTQRRWVSRRCAHARDRVLEGLASIETSDPFEEAVITWLFPTGITTHVLLVAGLKNPTVRRRYAAAKELLTDYGHLDLHESLLGVLGCAHTSRASVEGHLSALTELFDVAAAQMGTPFSFASDISALARPIAIDGSRDCIECGNHRAAMFWIAVTYSRCMSVLRRDAPAGLYARYEWTYRELLADMGITSVADLQRRREGVLDVLHDVSRVADDIMAANREIED